MRAGPRSGDAMLFNIEADRGDRITGYVVPDDYSGTPTLRVTDGAATIAMVPCAEERPALVAAGRHSTGLCGFSIDETIVPGLAENKSVELWDSGSGILIYRRRPTEEVVHKRIFRLETHLFPLWKLDDALEPRFQFFQKGVERHGRETATQVFLLTHSTSLYISGRLAFKSYESYLHDKFACVAVLHDPFFELAERLLTLKYVQRFGDDLLGARDMVSYEAAIDFARELELDDKSLRRGFANMPKPVIAALANPLTRILASESLDEPPPKGAIASALGALSTFAAVGARDREEVFLEALEALIEAPEGTLPPVPYFGSVGQFARRLRAIPEAEMLLEMDLEIYANVKESIDAAV